MSVERPTAATQRKSRKGSKAEGCQEEVSTWGWLVIKMKLKESTWSVLVKSKLSINVSDYRACQTVRGRERKPASASLLPSSTDLG